jgi:hypothetical protein
MSDSIVEQKPANPKAGDVRFFVGNGGSPELV